MSYRCSMARAVSNSQRIVHFHSIAYSVSRHAPPKRSQMAPRTILALGYTGWCLACPEAAVASTGGRSRTPHGGSRRARRTVIPLCNKPSSLSRHDGCIRAPRLKLCRGRGQHVVTVLSRAGRSKGSRTAVAERCRARALWSMPCGGEARRSARGWSSGTCDRSRESRVQLAQS